MGGRNDKKLKDLYKHEWSYDREVAEKRLRKILEEGEKPITEKSNKENAKE